MKRFLSVLLILCLTVAMVACGENKKSSTTAGKKSSVAATKAPTKAPTVPTKAPENSSNATPYTEGKTEHDSANGVPTFDDGVMREDLTAIEFTALMGNGINLGNTMEATGGENAWGQPTTTQAMLLAMKEGGFDSIRIPVGWTNAMPNYKTGDYTIDEKYLNRVEQIINYALNSGMYVIINDHWDRGWWGMFGNEGTRDAAWAMYESMWTTIANRYKEYSDYLIFESANEELGERLNDEIDGVNGTLTKDECYLFTHDINQKFVDIVRSTGGNNENRFLLIAGYNTDILNTCDDRYIMPEDSAKDKLMVSVHYYTPWDFCGTDGTLLWGSVEQLEQMNGLFESMTKFTEKGYGVIIGEYAVMRVKGEYKESTDLFYENLLDNCDVYGYVPMLWDCSDLFMRSSLEWSDEKIAAIFKDRQASDMSEEEKASTAKAAIAARIKDAAGNAEDFNVTDDENASVAWIMFNSGDWGIKYCPSNDYDPADRSPFLKTTDVVVDKAGTYTVGIDFTDIGTANGVAFMALGIKNANVNFKGSTIKIDEIKVNGSAIELTAVPYTICEGSDTLRVNLYNEWATNVPQKPVVAEGDDASKASSIVIDQAQFSKTETLEITFTLVE